MKNTITISKLWQEYKIGKCYSDPEGYKLLGIVEPPVWFLKNELGLSIFPESHVSITHPQQEILNAS